MLILINTFYKIPVNSSLPLFVVLVLPTCIQTFLLRGTDGSAGELTQIIATWWTVVSYRLKFL